MKIVKYEIDNNILLVGFRVDNFIIYSQVSYDKNKTKDELLQQAYIQAKPSIDYERTLDTHSFITDKEGESFTPELPKPSTLDVDFITLTGKVLDQYGGVYSTDVEFGIEGTDKVTIEENKLVEETVEEDTEYFIVARYGTIEESHRGIIHAPIRDRVLELETQLFSVQNYIVEKEYQGLLEKGGL